MYFFPPSPEIASDLLSLANKIAKDWRVAHLVPHLSKKGRSREGKEKKGWQKSEILFSY